jgi:hypothetical protein
MDRDRPIRSEVESTDGNYDESAFRAARFYNLPHKPGALLKCTKQRFQLTRLRAL